MENDYYFTLGISRCATEDEIKRAYRTQALKWHPDRNNDKTELAKRKFQKVHEAFQILGDKAKRSTYDHQSRQQEEVFNFPGGYCFSSSASSTMFDTSYAQDIFSQLFSSTLNSPPSSPPRNNKPVVKRTLDVSLDDLYLGATKKLKVTRQRDTEKILSIHIQPGWKAGTKIAFPEEEIEFEVKEKPHPLFTRDGDNLIMILDLSFVEALTGEYTKTITKLDNTVLTVSGQGDIIEPGQKITFQGHGMPNPKKGKSGDLVVVFKVNHPQKLDCNQKNIIRAFFA
ncbi:DnaJ-domain-containing protein [Backusella circina FSU 941]|nr:DnaJ-domain-containing protein [Backusella circina FSU 941]